jgi:hypothetical protein
MAVAEWRPPFGGGTYGATHPKGGRQQWPPAIVGTTKREGPSCSQKKLIFIFHLNIVNKLLQHKLYMTIGLDADHDEFQNVFSLYGGELFWMWRYIDFFVGSLGYV